MLAFEPKYLNRMRDISKRSMLAAQRIKFGTPEEIAHTTPVFYESLFEQVGHLTNFFSPLTFTEKVKPTESPAISKLVTANEREAIATEAIAMDSDKASEDIAAKEKTATIERHNEVDTIVTGIEDSDRQTAKTINLKLDEVIEAIEDLALLSHRQEQARDRRQRDRDKREKDRRDKDRQNTKDRDKQREKDRKPDIDSKTRKAATSDDFQKKWDDVDKRKTTASPDLDSKRHEIDLDRNRDRSRNQKRDIDFDKKQSKKLDFDKSKTRKSKLPSKSRKRGKLGLLSSIVDVGSMFVPTFLQSQQDDSVGGQVKEIVAEEVVDIGADKVSDKVESKVAKKATEKAGKKATEKAAKTAGKKATKSVGKKAVKTAGKSLAKKGATGLAGVAGGTLATGAAVAGAGLAGWEIGSLINDVVSEKTGSDSWLFDWMKTEDSPDPTLLPKQMKDQRQLYKAIYKLEEQIYDKKHEFWISDADEEIIKRKEHLLDVYKTVLERLKVNEAKKEALKTTKQPDTDLPKIVVSTPPIAVEKRQPTVVKETLDVKPKPIESKPGAFLPSITEEELKELYGVTASDTTKSSIETPTVPKTLLPPSPATMANITASKIETGSNVTDDAEEGKAPTQAGPTVAAAQKTGLKDITELTTGKSLKGVNPELQKRIGGAISEFNSKTGRDKKFQINSAYRSVEKQKQLYAAYKAGQGPPAARPGSSLHNFGMALDMQSVDLNALDKEGLLSKWGLRRPIRGETWHLEPSDIDRRKVKQTMGEEGGMTPIAIAPVTGATPPPDVPADSGPKADAQAVPTVPTTSETAQIPTSDTTPTTGAIDLAGSRAAKMQSDVPTAPATPTKGSATASPSSPIGMGAVDKIEKEASITTAAMSRTATMEQKPPQVNVAVPQQKQVPPVQNKTEVDDAGISLMMSILS